MNTVVISHEAAGSRGQNSHLPTIRFRAGCRWTAAGLWLALALLASGISFAPGAVAQDASWQDDQQPRRRARAAAPAYPDDNCAIVAWQVLSGAVPKAPP